MGWEGAVESGLLNAPKHAEAWQDREKCGVRQTGGGLLRWTCLGRISERRDWQGVDRTRRPAEGE